MKIYLFAVLVLVGLTACSNKGSANLPAVPPSNIAQPTPVPTFSAPKDGNYNGKGKVTKIDMKLGSVEIDHEEIVGLMPAMRMEFYVKDRSQLNDLKVGDTAEFVLEYKQSKETIVSITKTQ